MPGYMAPNLYRIMAENCACGNRKEFHSWCRTDFGSNQKMGTCHKEMNSDNYMQCIKEKILLKLLQKCIFMVYNTIYHNLLTEMCPTYSSILKNMKDWLLKHKIPFTSGF
jgi:hypothetical protein